MTPTCARKGCGHAKNKHRGGGGWDVRPCTERLPAGYPSAQAYHPPCRCMGYVEPPPPVWKDPERITMSQPHIARQLEGIERSEVFAQFFNRTMFADPDSDPMPLFELGAAIMLEKPILVIVLEEREADVPEKLRRFADKVLVVPDLGPASIALIKQAAEEME